MTPYETNAFKEHGRLAALENNADVEARVLSLCNKQQRYVWLAAKRKALRSRAGREAARRHWDFIESLKGPK